MAQFDVYPNPSKHQRSDIPWIVDIQGDPLAALPTRLVIPLALRKHMPPALPRALCPPIQREGDMLVVLPHMGSPLSNQGPGSFEGELAV
jgi:toxin CcdB